MTKWRHPHEHLDEVKCKTHPKYKVMRQPRSRCPDCWVAWIERNLCREFRGEAEEFLAECLERYAAIAMGQSARHWQEMKEFELQAEGGHDNPHTPKPKRY